MIIGVALFFLQSCAKEERVNIHPTDVDVVLKDVSYGSHERQKMDIYLPGGRERGTTRIFVFIHGGGWVAGSKDDLALDSAQLYVLKDQFPDVALITLNYRLTTESENQYPAAEEDIVRAMDHIYSNLEAYQLSADTYMSGGSAGAHLAALYTLKHDHANRVKGCIAISGAYNLAGLHETSNAEGKQLLEFFLGGTPSQLPQAYHAASPTNFVTASAPEFLLMHGREDPLTPLEQAEEMIAEFERLGVAYDSFLYSGGHGIPPQHVLEAFSRIRAFLQ